MFSLELKLTANAVDFMAKVAEFLQKYQLAREKRISVCKEPLLQCLDVA